MASLGTFTKYYTQQDIENALYDGNSYSNITTNTTTTLKSSAGTLVALTLNNPSALTVAALTVTVYDSTSASGTKIGTWTIPFGQTAAMPLQLLTKEVAFANGLTIVTAGPTVTGDLTAVYR